MGDPVKQGHRALGQVASLGDRPFVVDLEQDRPGQPGNGRLVGEDADHVAAPLDPLFTRSSGLVDQILRQ